MPIINAGFLRKMPKELSFDLLSWKTIETLLGQNRPFSDCLLLVRNRKNSEVVDYVLSRLKIGDCIEDILLSFKDPVCKQLVFYISFIPMHEALRIAIDMVTFEKEIKKSLSKALVYPCFLIVFSTLILFLFSYVILPTLVSMIDVGNHMVIVVISIMNKVIIVFYIVVVIFVSIFMFCYFQKRILSFWKIMHVLHCDFILQKYTTYVFSQYLFVLLSHGVSTKRSMEILSRFEDKPLVQFVGKLLDEQLLQGVSFSSVMHNEFLDNTFCMICQLGYQTNTFIHSLVEYKEVIEMWLRNSIQKLSIGIQFVAYGCIGMIVILVYQIMLLPLSLFESM